jgi:hypothetical protein
VITLPITEKGKVVNKGYFSPSIDIKSGLKVNTYCGALSYLEMEIGETVSTIGQISVTYNAKTKAFDWIFTQEKKRVPVKRNIKDLEYGTVQYQYHVWTVSTLDGTVNKAFIIEED